ncbi:Na+/H+ antiporter NhaA [Flavitalea sp.]|nr:Na+/H+ antiporter NhaA [Flavitalea sp.]
MKLGINYNVFREFVRSGSIGGIILLICVGLSLVIANSPFNESFSKFLDLEIGVENNYLHLRYPVLLWVNDGLMAIFFLLVGLEIKRELVEGELSSPKKASLPVLAAFGGAILPALIFAFFNYNRPTSAGWGIPMATDIAFAIGILSLLGNRVPSSLKVFLAALAIVDDLIAILVIALFYSSGLNTTNLMIAGGLFAFMLILNRLKVKSLFAYLIPGTLMWYFVHHSGIHATIAGVLTAITLPTNKVAAESPLEKLEHFLTRPVSYFIMPLFAIVNTNIRIGSSMFEGLASDVGLGILVGLVIGKPIGITLMSWLIVKMKLGTIPTGATWWHIIGLGLLGGIGFTMSIFIALLSYDDPSLQTESKFVILLSSVIAGIAGFLLLSSVNKRKNVVFQDRNSDFPDPGTAINTKD